jgi:beta-glucosidase
MVDLDVVLGQLTFDEKVSLLSGADTWRTTPIERLGIAPLKLSDGPVGVRGDATTTAACFASAIGLAASFDPDLALAVGRALDDELATKGAQVLLGPTVNLARHPLGGRNFECYGEDPLLAATMAAAMITGIQARGRGACVKHFVANDTEYRRLSVSVEVDERTLREVYLAPFEAAVTAGVWAVMAAYPRIGGTHATEHRDLLDGVLRREWGFGGVVVSDWGATHSPRAAAAGTDLEMPGPARAYGDRLVGAVRRGEVSEADVDRRARAVLGLLSRAGRIGGPPLGAESAVDRAEHRDLIRRAGAAGTVLVRNDALLPLDPSVLSRVAVIGPNAHPGRIQGGGSAQVPAHRAVSPLEGLRQGLGGGVVVDWHPGCLAHKFLPQVPLEAWCDAGEVERPVRLEVFPTPDLSGDPVQARATRRIGALIQGLQDGMPDPMSWSRRWRGRYRAGASGPHTFGVTAVGPARVLVDGALVVDNWTAPLPGESFFTKGSAEARSAVDLEAGQEVDVVVEWSRGTDPDLVGLRFGILPPTDEDVMMAAAVAAAAAAEVAVVVVGLDADWETEGVDRAGWDLPGRQAELVGRVIDANPRTVVVVNAGGVVDLPWLERAPATLIVWYPGQELGHALADVLLGRVDPGGRLPVTFPARLEDGPTWLDVPGDADRLHYREGLFVGHRWYDARRIEPRIPFGHGLSYAELHLGPPVLAGDRADGGAEIVVPVENRSERAGRAVVQLYLEPPAGAHTRPVRALAAFAALDVPGRSTVEARLRVPRRRFEVWDPDRSGWVLPSGSYRLRVGASSADLGAAVAVER